MSDPMNHTLTRHQYRIDDVRHGHEKDAQHRAEKEGHVPPGVGPLEVIAWGSSTSDYVWQWITGDDPTGETTEVWFADGPLSGQSRAIPYAVEVGDRLPVKAWPLAAGPNAEQLRATEDVYEVQQREDGLWYGRIVS
jgi:hypothetical protein